MIELYRESEQQIFTRDLILLSSCNASRKRSQHFVHDEENRTFSFDFTAQPFTLCTFSILFSIHFQRCHKENLFNNQEFL